MIIRGADEMRIAAEGVVRDLIPDTQSARIITLSGELGAGKTTFTQGVAKALGVDEVVTSPTFVLEKIYKLEDQKFSHLVHIDAYRLKGAHELEVLGWKELLADSGNLILLEWPERVEGAIPSNAIRITFEINGEERILKLNGQESSKK